MIVKNDLFDYENRYIYQDSRYFKFSLDSILLAEFVTLKKNDFVVDMCAGNMAVGLILSKYYDNKIAGFEIQKEIYDLGQKSININEMENQLSLINDDINNISNYYDKSSIDVMVCNPPFFKVTDEKVTNETLIKAIARHEIKLNLEQIFNLSKSMLKENGILYMVHRANRLDEIINLGYKYKLNVKLINFISTKEGQKPSIVLVKCKKNSNAGIIINNEICIENLKSYKNLFRKE